MQGRDNPGEFGLFLGPNSLPDCLFLFLPLILGHKTPLFGFFETLHSLSGFLLLFSFVFLDFMLQESVVFLDIRIGFLPQLFPPFIVLHDFIAVWILFCIVSVKTSGFMLTAAAVRIRFCQLSFPVFFNDLPDFGHSFDHKHMGIPRSIFRAIPKKETARMVQTAFVIL